MASLGDSEQVYAAKVKELREFFCKEYAEKLSNGEFHPKDVERVQNDDKYLRCFVKSYSDKSMDVTLPAQKLHDCLLFRQEIRLNDFQIESLPKEIAERHAIYWKGEDLEGRDIMLFRILNHQKGVYVEEVKRLIAYMFDQHHKNKTGQRIVIIFDFSGAGVTNMDLDVTKFIIKSLTDYFPGLLAHILIYEVPFLLNAIWKIIRSWLSEDQKQRVKQVSKKDLCKYVANDQLEPHMVKK